MDALLTAFLILSFPALSFAQGGDRLSRRADLGAAINPPSTTAARARVVRVVDGSPLARAGLRVGDEVTAVDDHRLSDSVEFDRRIAALRGGRTIRLDIVREGKSQTITATPDPLPRERIDGVELAYSEIANPRGPRQRAIFSRPAGAGRPLPAILFVPWLSCDSVESPVAPAPGIDQLLHQLAAQSGWVMLRIDKPGVGDSEGVCADTDLDTEIAGSRAGLAALRSHPWVDARRIVIMGHSFSGAFLPLVVGETPVAGYIFINSWSRTWLERLIEFERLRLEGSGTRPADTTSQVRKLSEFYTLFLEQQKTPGEILKERPELRDVWTDEPGHQYGRSARFHHQLQAIDPGAAWEKVDVATLVMWSDADIVMHRWDHERLVAIVNRNKADAATLVVVPGDHGLAVRGSDGKPVLPGIAARNILEFLKRL
jgi:pimeloyl-ACP methyl ester carboxylesterase